MSGRFKKIQTASQFLVIVVFIALLWLPTLDGFFHLDKAPMPNEQRELAKFPQFEPALPKIREFISGVESYYNDHFGFRKRLIRWNNRWKRKWFREKATADVITGRDGWLFYSGAQMIEHFQGIKKFSEQDLRKWQDLLEGRRNWLKERGIRYIFVIPPDKHNVYPEFLPEWLERKATSTKVDQLVEYMKTHSDIEILDLRSSLVEAKKIRRTYLYTDTHWNMFGGFVGYEKLVQTLSEFYPGLTPLSISDFEEKSATYPGGDLAKMLGQSDSLPEKDYLELTPKPSLPPLTIEIQTNLLGKKWFKAAEPVVTRNPAAQRKMIVFRDSFSGAFIPFLGYHFNEIYYIWQYNWDKAFIEKEKPDIVMDEMLERFFNIEDPDKLKRLDEQPAATVASHSQ